MPSSTLASATTEPDAPATARASGFWADTLHRVVRNRAAVTGGVVVAIFVVVAGLAPVLSPYDPLKGGLGNRLRAPSATHWLGTDELGRDVLSRVLYGARITAPIQVAAVGLGLVLGTALRLSAGCVRGSKDQTSRRLLH